MLVHTVTFSVYTILTISDRIVNAVYYSKYAKNHARGENCL